LLLKHRLLPLFINFLELGFCEVHVRTPA
jgi:hypothetical protein